MKLIGEVRGDFHEESNPEVDPFDLQLGIDYIEANSVGGIANISYTFGTTELGKHLQAIFQLYCVPWAPVGRIIRVDSDAQRFAVYTGDHDKFWAPATCIDMVCNYIRVPDKDVAVIFDCELEYLERVGYGSKKEVIRIRASDWAIEPEVADELKYLEAFHRRVFGEPTSDTD